MMLHSTQLLAAGFLVLSVGSAGCSGSRLVGRDLDEAMGGSGVIGVGGAGVPPDLDASAPTGGATHAASASGGSGTPGGTSASAGGPASSCSGLGCLAGYRFVFEPSRRWTRGSLAGDDVLPEAEFSPAADLPRYVVQFAPNGVSASLAQVSSGSYPDPYGVLGPRASSPEFNFSDGWTGERLIVSRVADGLEGDLTFWGSGVPVVDALRGPLVFTHAYDNQGEACGLPIAQMPDTYPPFPRTYDDALAAGTGCGKRCAGLRNGYCSGTCAGYLVWEDRCWDVPVSIAYDPATRALVGYAWGDESSAICRGQFPPRAVDGRKGWDPSRIDIALACEE